MKVKSISWDQKSTIVSLLTAISVLSARNLAKDLNALKRLGGFLNISQSKVLPLSSIVEHFNYCPGVWNFCSTKDKQKIDRMQERTLRLVYQITSHHAYSEVLDKRRTKTELRQIQFICTQIYKTINNMGPEDTNSLVVPNQSNYFSRRPLNLFVTRINQTTYGLRRFRY